MKVIGSRSKSQEEKGRKFPFPHCKGDLVKPCLHFIAVGIRGEDAGTLVCYKMDDDISEDDKARLELKVLGMVAVLRSVFS